MANLGDCDCIPKNDKEDLIKAIGLAKDFYENVVEGKWRLSDIKFIEHTINDTPACEDGDISKECTCFSNLERRSIDLVIETANNRLKKFSDVPTLNSLRTIRTKIKDIKGKC